MRRGLALVGALGATRATILALVLGEGARLAMLGLVLGIPAALVLTPLAGGLLYDVSPTDLMTFIVVPIALGGVSVLAAIAPARRAAKVDPVVAMRAD